MPSRQSIESRVWSRMAATWPLFTHSHDIFNDASAVEGLLLGDFLGWRPFTGARVLDIGANAGIVSAWCALYGCESVTAYEADPVTAQLTHNMAISTGLYPRLTVVNAAIWFYTGTVPYHGNGWDNATDGRGRNGAIQVVGAGPNSGGNTAPGAFHGNTPTIHDSTPRVACISLSDALLYEDGDGGSRGHGLGRRWDFVKMDIEGAEFQTLLSTPDEYLALIDFLQIEFHNGWADDIIYSRLIEKLSRTFDHTGSIASAADEHSGRYHYGQFRNKGVV
jgi:FkbM family methyltransferase